MSRHPRYAIYFVPDADSALYRFGAALLGYDVFTGLAIPFADGIEEEIESWKQISSDPRKYGFHATLKAPIALASDKTEAQLVAAILDFATASRAVPVIRPVIRAIGSFVAIVPEEPSPELQQLADDCVTTFDAFRAPLTAQDRERRKPGSLTSKQSALLDRWGYPYVFEEFRFHMTLTGSLPPERRTGILELLTERFATVGLTSISVGELALLRQDEPTSPFAVIMHAKLTQRS